VNVGAKVVLVERTQSQVPGLLDLLMREKEKKVNKCTSVQELLVRYDTHFLNELHSFSEGVWLMMTDV
jgi:hypothetical protein